MGARVPTSLEIWLRERYVVLRDNDRFYVRTLRESASHGSSWLRRNLRRGLRVSHRFLDNAVFARLDRALLRSALATTLSLGLPSAQKLIFGATNSSGRRARVLFELARRLQETHRPLAIECFGLAYDACPGPAAAARIAAMLFAAGDIARAERLSRLSGDEHADHFARSELWLAARLLQTPLLVPRRGRPRLPGSGVAYVAASAEPYVNAGYTVRTHQLLSSLTAAGVAVRCYLRPGFPWDRKDAAIGEPGVPDVLRVGSVDYVYSPINGADRSTLIERSADVIEQRLRGSPPSIVHAASNCRNALPALIAARRLGLPFIYEVRGLWELTAAVTRPDWEATERFALDRRLESLVALEADHVFAITHALAAELADIGVAASRISILPNAVDPTQFLPQQKDRALVVALGLEGAELTLVYAGSLTAYEGLDDLIGAVDQLRDRGRVAKLVIVGAGKERAQLTALAEQRKLTGNVHFVGRVAPDQVARYWSLADAVALPRKNHKVCRIVSPLKPFEVMAMRIPVVLSDLPVMHEIVQDGVTGRICRPDDPGHLAEVLENLMDDPGQRSRLGAAGRDWLLSNRTWAANAAAMKTVYDRLNRTSLTENYTDQYQPAA